MYSEGTNYPMREDYTTGQPNFPNVQQEQNEPFIAGVTVTILALLITNYLFGSFIPTVLCAIMMLGSWLLSQSYDKRYFWAFVAFGTTLGMLVFVLGQFA